MLSWLSANLATIVLGVILLAVVVLILVTIFRDKKKGKSSCGCNCSSCPMGGNCHPKK